MDETAVYPAFVDDAPTELLGAVVDPDTMEPESGRHRSVPQPPPPANKLYASPSSDYMMGLRASMREAAAKANAWSKRYNALTQALQAKAEGSETRSAEHQRLAVKFATKGNTDIVDADRQYQFWKGEQLRLCGQIAAEYEMWRMYPHG